MITDLQKLEELKKLTMSLVSSQKKLKTLSEKRRNMDYSNSTEKAIQNADANLNWHAMEHSKLKTEVHAVSVDCGLSELRDNYDEVTYQPSGWHKYTHMPRKPLVIQNR